MSQKSELIDLYRKKISLLKKHNKLYFGKDDPKITDSQYDSLKKEILDLEKNNNFLKKLGLNEELLGPLHQINLKKLNI